MHVLVAFIIGIALYSGFHPVKEAPKDRMHVVVDTNAQTRVTDRVTPVSETQNQHLVHQMYDYSCGSAALATILNYHLGEEFKERQVIQGLLQYGNSEKIAEKRAFSLLDMKKFVDVLGYKGVGYKASYEDLETLDVPCILPIKLFGYRHFAVLKGIYKGHVFLADPWRGNISFSKSEFMDKWYKNVIFIVHAKGQQTLSMLKLNKQDLRIIDEDDARRILTDPTLNTRLPIDRRQNNTDKQFRYYKR